MHISRARFWMLSATAMALLATLALALTMTGGRNSRSAIANSTMTITPPTSVPTSTPTPGAPLPTATAKPGNTGELSGLYDLWVTGGIYPVPDKHAGLVNCIALLNRDATTNQVKIAAQCAPDSGGFGDPNNEVPGIPSEATDGFPGPPPPPQYQPFKPAKITGAYNPVTDTLTASLCFENVGGSLAPYIIADLVFKGAVNQLHTSGKLQGSSGIYGAQSTQQCFGGQPHFGPLYLNSLLNIKMQPADPANPACNPHPCDRTAWRIAHTLDYDNDGCTDVQELTKPSPASGCGDDPWNPFDSKVGTGNTNPGAGDYSGTWYLLGTVRRADSCYNGTSATNPAIYNCASHADGTFVPGAYFHCYADIQQTGKKLTTRLLCYIDYGPAVTGLGPGTPKDVNPLQAPGESGDGNPGPAPPGITRPGGPHLFAHIGSKHTQLSGVVDTTNDTIRLFGCFADSTGSLGNYYLNATLNAHTWQGKATIWTSQVLSACTGGNPSGNQADLALEGAKLQAKSPARDTDQDGCPDVNELSDDPTVGGLRDPANPWDYFNPLNNDINRTGDITAVVNKYGQDDDGGHPLYAKKYDRGGSIPGSNKWNFQPPDGIIRTADITAAVNSYGHDCGVGTDKTPVPPAATPTLIIKSPPPPTWTPTP